MSYSLSCLSPEVITSLEIAMMEDAFAAAPEDVSKRYDYGRRRLGEAVLAYCSGVPDHSILNRLVGLTSSQSNWKQHLKAAIDEFGRRGVSAVIEANAADLLLVDDLFKLGLRPIAEGTFTLVRSCYPAPTNECALPIRELTAENGEQFVDTVSTVFQMPADFVHHYACFIGRPGWTIFGAFDGPTLVAVGGLYFEGDRALMCFGATRSNYRGRGLQRAIISRRIEEAARRGSTYLSTSVASPTSGASGPSFRNAHKAGFRVAFERILFSRRLSSNGF